MTVLTTVNDDAHAAGPLRGPDAHGQAAMLLVESLIHGLIARSVIRTVDAVEIVGIAADVKEAVADELGDSPSNMQKSLNLLDAIRNSLSSDLVGEEVRPWPPTT